MSNAPDVSALMVKFSSLPGVQAVGMVDPMTALRHE